MPERKDQQINYLISFFNTKNGTIYRYNTESTREIIRKALDVADVAEIKQYINDRKGGEKITKVFEDFIKEKSADTQSQKEEPAKTHLKAEAEKVETVNNYMGLLEQTLAEVIVKTKGDEITKGLISSIGAKVDAYIEEKYGTIKRKIELEVGEKKVEMEGVLHDKFDTVLKFVANNEPVFLTGPAGSGKNVLCQQVAKALDLPFYFSNAVTQEYKITGFTDAMGVFHETQFYKAFKHGGLFMLDEIDASIPEVLVILNAAIANRYFDFPAPIGYVEAHKDFRVVAAGNTFGLGADYEYVGRNQLDMASLDRFAMVQIDYSEAIEMRVTGNNRELVKFAREFRESARKNGVKCLFSYRSLSRISKMEEVLGIEEALKTCLVKSLQKDDIQMIIGDINTRNKYYNALRAIKEAM